MNYWKYIVISLLGLVAVFHIGAVWYVSTAGGSYDLTSPDYYAKEIRYQETIDQLKAGKAYKWDYRISNGQFSLAVSDHSGEARSLENVVLHLYRPNDADQDITIPLEAGGNGFRAALPELEKGSWKLTIEALNGSEQLAFKDRVSL